MLGIPTIPNATPEFLDGIPPMEEPPQGALATDEPMTELPRKADGLIAGRRP